MNDVPVPSEAGASLRVLVVENDDADMLDAIRCVEDACARGTIEAVTTSATTYAEAYRLISSEYFDLVLLDLVLHDGIAGDPEGWEGLWLLQDLAELQLQSEVAVAVVSAFGTVGVANLTLSRFSVLRFWEKGNPAELADNLYELLEYRSFFGLRLAVEGASSWKDMVVNLGRNQFVPAPFPVSVPSAAVELEHLFRRIFSEASAISVEPLLGGHSGAGVVRVERTRGTARLPPAVAKFGSAPLIKAEETNYHNFTEFLDENRVTQLTNVAVGRYLGVVKYTFLGAQLDRLVAFPQFYAGSTVAPITAALRSVFLEDLRLCFVEDNRQAKSVSLRNVYMSDFGFTVANIEQAFAFKFGQPLNEPNVSFIDVPRALPHPVAALRADDTAATVETWFCPTHGDLHGDNLLVDRELHQAWMIDFASAGFGHWARDFAAAECSIKFRYTPPTDLADLFELEDFLATRRKFGEQGRFRVRDQPIAKAYETITALRSMISDVTVSYPAEKVSREYYTALYFTTLNYLRFHQRLKSKVRKNQILMSAGIALEQMQTV